MKIYVILFATFCLCLASCTVKRVDHRQITVEDYEHLEESDGKIVTLVGYVSLTHGATGIYFSKRDLIKENEKCILPVPQSFTSHGKKITVTGVVKKTECYYQSICTNNCSAFELLIKNEGK